MDIPVSDVDILVSKVGILVSKLDISVSKVDASVSKVDTPVSKEDTSVSKGTSQSLMKPGVFSDLGCSAEHVLKVGEPLFFISDISTVTVAHHLIVVKVS